MTTRSPTGSTSTRLSASRGARDLPGLRTLRSARFRLVLGALLWAVGGVVLGLALARQASDPAGQFGIDFSAYYRAAEALATGVSPYTPDQLAGAFAAQGVDQYLYPPTFAQLLMPLTLLPEGVAATVWLAAQLAAILGATWLAAGIGGVPRSLGRVIWCGAAATWFLPAFDTLWKGNVSGVIALLIALVALGGSAAGLAAAAGTVLKVVPVAWLPMVAAMGRPAIRAGVVLAAALLVPSVILAPNAWLDYLHVLPNLAAGAADQATNLAPWAMAERAGLPAPVPAAIRVASVAAAIGLAGAGALVVRRVPGSRGRAAAVTLATLAMLLLPAACWYHYLVALLPVAALAWGVARTAERLAIVAGGACVTLAIAWLPLALVGTVLLTLGALRAHTASASPSPTRPTPIRPVALLDAGR